MNVPSERIYPWNFPLLSYDTCVYFKAAPALCLLLGLLSLYFTRSHRCLLLNPLSAPRFAHCLPLALYMLDFPAGSDFNVIRQKAMIILWQPISTSMIEINNIFKRLLQGQLLLAKIGLYVSP